MKKIFTLCVVLCMSYLTMGASTSKHEFRATWLATVSGIDWPKTKATNDATREQQKQELIDILDKMKAGNLNAVCFQVRSLCDAMYQSSYEPWSIALTGTRGKDPGYDPLQFAIDEAHKRGMELHVWVNPFRASTSTLAATDMLWDNAGDWLIKYDNSSFSGYLIDPGYPESRAYVVKVLMEIINNYDVDGLVMDDYFYAYGGTTNQDSVAQALHYRASEVIDVNNNGNKIDDWRRSNVDNVIKAMYDSIQVVKPWVRFGMGPGGIWSMDKNAAEAYGLTLPSGIRGSDPYTELYCNTVEWIKQGWVDYVNPQIYWSTQVAAQDYDVLCQWWSKDVCEHFSNLLPNGKKVHHFPSPAAYKVYGDYLGYEDGVEEMKREMDANRANLSSGYTGAVFYSTTSYLQMSEELAESHFTHTALTPPMEWKVKGDLAAPTNLQLSGTTLSWQHPTAERFTVYAYPKGIGVNTATSNPQYLQAVVYDKSFNTSSLGSLSNITIAVYSYDRYGVEHGVALYNADPNATDDPEPEPEPEPEPSNTITWELNGGEVNTSSIEVPSQSDLMLQFMNSYTSYFGTPTSDIDAFYPSNISGFLYRGKSAHEKSVNEMILDETAGWKWLADYIVSTSASNTSILAALNSGTEVYWRYSIAAFFEQNGSGTYNVDFSTAGQPAAWGPTYQVAHGMVLLPTYVTSAYTLPTPTHPEGLTFLGWYDNPAFSGSSLTIISAHWTGTLYAKWQEDTPTIDPTWQITYTSTDGNIVTPTQADVFGANIVSNTYENGVGTITFDGPVTSIGENAFYGCSSLISITIPNSVTSIGSYAFYNCSFTSLTIPDGVMSIGPSAFLDCYLLTSIIIPNSVTSIRYAAFGGCSRLSSMVVESGNTIYDSREDCNAIIETATNTLISGCQNTIIPNSVTTIYAGAFYRCRVTLKSITIPNSVRTIGDYAFGWCSSLTSVTLSSSVTSIGDRAFYSCSSLKSINIPNNVASIGEYAFYGCSSLYTIRVEATTPPTLGVDAFTSSPLCNIPCGTLAAYEASDWASQVGEFVEEGCAPIQTCGDDLYWEYADGVLTITGTGEMYDYAADTDVPWYDVRGNIKTVSLPDAMTKIGQNAFYKCTAMTSINMPTSLTAIGEKAFAQDTKLACEIILPASMTTIASRAFFNCKAVPAFHVEATTPPTVQADAFDYTTAPIHIPCGYGHIYGKHAQWGMLNLEMCELLQDNVYYYPINGHTARAVTYHSNPTDTIVIPSAVVIDGMPRTVTEVADFAFTDCDDLPAIYFNEGLEYIGERAFVRCYGLHGTIVLPATLETIGERAFSYCNNVEKYLIQAMTPPALGDGAFTCANHDALFYVSCEVMDDYKVAARWSSLKSRLRDACLNIYHYNTPLGTNGVYTTEDTLVASIYYRRKFTPYRWETLYLPFEVDRVTVLEYGVEYDLTAWDIVYGGHYFLAKPDGMLNKEILFGFTDELESHTPYIIQFSDAYYTDKLITFYGKESWNKLSTSFEVLSSSAWMQIAGNTTLQDQTLEEPVYMLRGTSNFILQNTTTTLHPFECYVMPYATPSGTPARMNVRLRDDVATAVESVKGNESRLAYTINDHTLTVYPQGQAFSIYSLNGALIYSCEAGKEAVDCELNSGCYLLHAGTEAHKIML